MAPFRFVFLLFISSFFILGLYDYLVNYEENGCEMTYMYERPQYLVSFAKSHFYAPPTIISSSSEYRSFIDMGRPVNRVNVPGYDVVWIQWWHGWVYVILSAGIKIGLRLSDFFKCTLRCRHRDNFGILPHRGWIHFSLDFAGVKTWLLPLRGV